MLNASLLGKIPSSPTNMVVYCQAVLIMASSEQVKGQAQEDTTPPGICGPRASVDNTRPCSLGT
jgi:hypothetical protein